MNEATPYNRHVLKDGTVLVRVKPSEVGDRKRWYSNNDHSPVINNRDEMHDNRLDVSDDSEWTAWVEALPPPKRYRRDLKPGTVFRYQWTWGESREPWWVVDGVHALTPAEFGYTSVSDTKGWAPDQPVTVLWEPPTESAKVDPFENVKPEAGVDPKAAFNSRKVNVQYVPPAVIAAISEALDEGRVKYGCAKWRETKTEMMTYIGGALRHLYAFIDGEDVDPESKNGKTHLAGALASLAILVDCIAMDRIVDNRPPRGPQGLFRMKEAK